MVAAITLAEGIFEYCKEKLGVRREATKNTAFYDFMRKVIQESDKHCQGDVYKFFGLYRQIKVYRNDLVHVDHYHQDRNAYFKERMEEFSSLYNNKVAVDPALENEIPKALRKAVDVVDPTGINRKKYLRR